MSALAVHKATLGARLHIPWSSKNKVPSDVIKHVKLGNDKWRNLWENES